MVGAHGVEVPPLQSLPQGLLVFQGPGGRGKDVLGRLKAGQAVAAFVQQQILGAGLQIDLLPRSRAARACSSPRRVDRWTTFTGYPAHSAMASPAVHRLGLHRRGAGPGDGRRGPRRPAVFCCPDALVDQIAVFTVAAQHAPLAAHRLDHLAGHSVAQAQVVVGR